MIENKKIQDKLNKPIYICGSARSGTTLLFNLLNVSKEVHKLPTMSHFYSNFVRNNYFMHFRLKQILYKKILPWFDIEKICIQNSISFEKYNNDINRAIKNKNYKLLYKFYAFFSMIDKEYNKKPINNIKHWLDKSNNWRGLYKLKQWFPKTEFIFIIRNPKSVLASQLYRNKLDEQLIEISDLKFLKFLESWFFMNLKILNMSKKQKSKLIFFENLINNYQYEIDQLFDYLKINNIENKKIIEFFNNFKGRSIFNNKDININKIDLETKDHWKNILSNKQDKLIDSFFSYNANVHNLYLNLRISNLFKVNFFSALNSLQVSFFIKIKFFCKIFVIFLLYKFNLL